MDIRRSLASLLLLSLAACGGAAPAASSPAPPIAEAISNALSFSTNPQLKTADPKQFFDNSLLDAIAKEPV